MNINHIPPIKPSHPRERIRPIPLITRDILNRNPVIHPLQFSREQMDGTPDRHGDVLVWRPGLPEEGKGGGKGGGKGEHYSHPKDYPELHGLNDAIAEEVLEMVEGKGKGEGKSESKPKSKRRTSQ